MKNDTQYLKNDNDDALPEGAIDQSTWSTVDRRIYETQSYFLDEYQTCGTIKGAARAVHVSRETVYQWQRADKLGFAARFRAAQETFRESLEEIMFERLRDPKTHPVLLIFALKGHWREKYGDASLPVEDSAREMLAELKRIQQQRRLAVEANGHDGGG